MLDPFGWYVLIDGQVEVEPDGFNLTTWKRDHTDWIVGFDKFKNDEIEVSTVFLFTPHYGVGPIPNALWETMIFGGVLDGHMWRYLSEEEAREGHKRACAFVEAALDPTAAEL